jgi:hypothetical protein
MNKPFLILLSLLPLFLNAQMQNNYLRADSIQVYDNGDTLKFPFAGGLNAPEYSAIDLNFDGILDMIIFDREDSKIRTFINNGSPNIIDYSYQPQFEAFFPDTSKFFVLTYDFDGDGKLDLFTYFDSGIAVLKNNGDASNGLSFVQYSDSMIVSDYGLNIKRIGILGSDIPALVDVDLDGDMDILTFELQGLQMEYHQNLSMDLFGHADSLVFTLADPCWGKFEENFNTNAVTLNTFCKGGKRQVHSGSSVLALDLDGDKDKDVLLGDLTFKNVTGLINGGDTLSSLIDSQDTKFPEYAGQVNIIFPANYYLDVNNDGVRDLISATNSANASPNNASSWLYLNEGKDDSAEFNFIQNNFLQDEMIEVGEGGRPVLFDYNQDGKLDIMLGNDGYYLGNGVYNGRLALLENTGTTTQPKFEIIDKDYLNISSLGFRSVHPTFGDLDDDGDMDMILGELEGFLHFYENTAGPGNPVQFVLTTPYYKSIDIGRSSTPQLFDVNADGKLDLIIGEQDGNVNYFENIGSAQNADFNSTPTNATFGNIEVMPECCTGFTTPHMTRNNQNQMMLFVGTEQGYILTYDFIENNLNGTFQVIDSIPTNGKYISLSTGDLFNDKGSDIIFGQSTGGIAILRQTQNYVLGENKVTKATNTIKVYPTIFTSNIMVESENKLEQIRIYDTQGRLIESIAPSNKENTGIDLQHLRKGSYILQCMTKNSSNSIRLTKI